MYICFIMEDDMNDKVVKLLECKCTSNQHIMILSKDEDGYFVSIHLAPHNFFTRIFYAIKYVFGYRSKYGDFEEILLSKDAVKVLKSLDG